MRLRIVHLPRGIDSTPYLVILDNTDDLDTDSMGGLNEYLTTQSGGQCHGVIIIEGNLEIE